MCDCSIRQSFWPARGTPIVVPVVESAMPDEEEHMVFKHGFIPESEETVNGKVVEQGPRICTSDCDGHKFGERWERTGPRKGRRLDPEM